MQQFQMQIIIKQTKVKHQILRYNNYNARDNGELIHKLGIVSNLISDSLPNVF